MKIGNYVFSIDPNWELIAILSRIDYYDGYWNGFQKKDDVRLEILKLQAALKNTAASTRIAGSRMSDEQVEELLQDKKNIPGDRDSKEVAGYYDSIELISKSYEDINITEDSLKALHSICLRYVNKYQQQYKMGNNSVEAFRADGSKKMVFQTSEPGEVTEEAMTELISWYNNNDDIHPLVRSAVFVYVFERIHPFEDANGRMSRLLIFLFLLKNGYTWARYVSLDSEIEQRRNEYYTAMRSYPVHEEGEEIATWMKFFFEVIISAQQKLFQELVSGMDRTLSPRDRSILEIIAGSPGCKSGEIAEKTRIPAPTIKRLLTDLYTRNLIERHGSGPGTNYSIK